MIGNLKNKRGELTTRQIVILIILIVSFIVILLLLFRLNLKGETDKEICHNSVVMADKAFGLVGSIDCKTNYVCISSGSGGDKCKDFNPTQTIKIDLSDPNAKNLTIQVIVEEMTDCWWMFGEGKLDYGGSDVLGGNVCALCSIISFDKEIHGSLNEITYNEFYNYLLNTKKDNTQTYLKYFYNVNSITQLENNLPISDYLNNKIEFNKQYFILTGLSKAGLWGKWPLGKNEVIVPLILEKTSNNYKKIDCSDFITKA